MQVTESADRLTRSQEQELIRRAVQGGADAFAALYDHYVDRIYRFLKYRAPDDDTAEDLTSEVFLRAWDHLDGFDPGGAPFGAWLFRIARNLAIDHSRTRKPQVALDDIPHRERDPAPPIEDRVAQRLEQEQFLELLGELTEGQREVLYLKFVEGLGTKEVGRVMGKRPGAVRALQMRALQSLQEVLEQAGGGDDEQA